MKLTLWNFQKHEKLVVDLSSPITSIVGPTDSGKTSIIRAFYWVVFNRPSGMEFKSHAHIAKFVRVRLDIDGRIVRRTRGDDNIYALDGMIFHAFGTGVPEEIQKVLNISEVNFQCQLDPPFWFMKSPGEVSRELNAIINLGLIDKTLSNLSTKKHRAREQVKFTEERLNKATMERMKLSWVPQAEQDFQQMEYTEDQLVVKRAEIAELDVLIEKLDLSQKQQTDLSEAILDAKKVALCGSETVSLDSGIESLSSLIERITKTEELVNLYVPLDEVNSLGILRKEIETIGNQENTLDQLIHAIEQSEEEICRSEKSYIVAKKELDKQLNGLCPVCSQPLPHEL